jgi:hypothetical protein
MLNSYLMVIGFSCSFAMFAPQVGATSVYKWVDEKGVTQYSTTPPPGMPAQTIKAEPNKQVAPEKVASDTGKDNKGAAEGIPGETTAQTSPEGKRPDDPQRAEQKAIGEKVCQELRDNLERMQRYTRLYEKDAQGEITWLTEEQRQQRIEETQQQIKEFCE